MSVTAVYCCKPVSGKICMWAPGLLSYCDPIPVRGGGMLKRQTTETKAFSLSFPTASPHRPHLQPVLSLLRATASCWEEVCLCGDHRLVEGSAFWVQRRF